MYFMFIFTTFDLYLYLETTGKLGQEKVSLKVKTE